MITSVTLENFKSFGAARTVPLQPMTVLVGPNNSGKSNFLSFAQFVSQLASFDFSTVVESQGGMSAIRHRPVNPDARMRLGWKTSEGEYRSELAFDLDSLLGGTEALTCQGDQRDQIPRFEEPFRGLKELSENPEMWPGWAVVAPVVSSRFVKLSLGRLREDSPPSPRPRLTPDGFGLAQVLSVWRGAYPEKAQQLDEFVRKSLPEVRDVLVEPAPEPGFQRLVIRQKDNERFDAKQLSDGVLCFVALAMHLIDAPPGALILVEEPEQSIHRTRIHDIVDALRRVVTERGCQVLIATHSRVLLDEFRDEPDSILLFRRTDQGTDVRSLAQLPALAEQLSRQLPGEMLESGFFDQPFESLGG